MDALNAAESALRALGGIVESRLEMFSLETVIEKRRAACLLAAVMLAAGFALLGVSFAGIFLILLAPVEYRVHVAGVWMLLNAMLAAVCVALLLYALRKGSAPFEHTREELRKDFACLGTVVKSGE
ncbi:MAG: hypothetical protein CML13_11830 [Puniceicoccaceae bacterium]|nr:hypothetical protein [Puniceicoccaceae bacterium]|tara:strand:- start:3083 stop:3460 length:378 start_codon:yes stop_codon:yes gene_type:complete